MLGVLFGVGPRIERRNVFARPRAFFALNDVFQAVHEFVGKTDALARTKREAGIGDAAFEFEEHLDFVHVVIVGGRWIYHGAHAPVCDHVWDRADDRGITHLAKVCREEYTRWMLSLPEMFDDGG